MPQTQKTFYRITRKLSQDQAPQSWESRYGTEVAELRVNPSHPGNHRKPLKKADVLDATPRRVMARTEPEVKLSASARWSRAMGQINEARFRGPGHLHQYLDSLDQAFDTLTSLDAYPGDVTQDEIELRFEQVFRMSLEAFVRFDPDTLRDRAAADRLVQLPLKSAQRAGAKGNAMLGATISALTDMLARLETKPSNTAFRARIAERRNGLWNELLGRSQAAWHSSSASRESLFTSIAVLMSLFCTLEPEEPHTVDCMRQVRKIPEAHARLEEIVQKPPFEVNEDEPLAAVFARGVSALDRRARTSPP